MERAIDEEASEVVHVDEAAPVADGPEGQRPRSVREVQEREEVTLGAASIHERRAHDDHLEAWHGGQRLFRKRLGSAIGILRGRRIACAKRPLSRLLAVHFDRAQEDEAARTALRRGERESACLLHIVAKVGLLACEARLVCARGEMEHGRIAKVRRCHLIEPIVIAEAKPRGGSFQVGNEDLTNEARRS